MVYFLGGILIGLPSRLLIHEVGHAFFVKIFGGQIEKIKMGEGKKICSIGLIDIHGWYFVRGSIAFNNIKIKTKISNVLILLGGLIFNFITLELVNYLGKLHNPSFMVVMGYGDPISIILRTIVEYSILILILNLLPIKLFGMNTDGKQLYQFIKYRKSSLYEDIKSID